MDRSEHLKFISNQLFCQGNFELVESTFSSEYIAHAGEKTYSGHKFIKQFIKQVRKAIPDIRIVRIDILSNAENKLTWQRTFTGTNKFSLKGIAASNKKVKWYEIVVSRFENDKIVEEWISSDLAFQLMMKHK